MGTAAESFAEVVPEFIHAPNVTKYYFSSGFLNVYTTDIVKEKNILTLAKPVRKILFRIIAMDVDCCNRGERSVSTLNTTKTAGNLY